MIYVEALRQGVETVMIAGPSVAGPKRVILLVWVIIHLIVMVRLAFTFRGCSVNVCLLELLEILRSHGLIVLCDSNKNLIASFADY